MEEPPHCRLYNWFIQSNLLQDLYKQVDETLAVQRLIIPVDTSALLEFDSHLGNCLVGNYDRFCKITKEVCFEVLECSEFQIASMNQLCCIVKPSPLLPMKAITQDVVCPLVCLWGQVQSMKDVEQYTRSTRYRCTREECLGAGDTAHIRVHVPGSLESQTVRSDLKCQFCGDILYEERSARQIGSRRTVMLEVDDKPQERYFVKSLVSVTVRDELLDVIYLGAKFVIVGVMITNINREDCTLQSFVNAVNVVRWTCPTPHLIPRSLREIYKTRESSPWQVLSLLAYCICPEILPQGSYHSLKQILLLSLVGGRELTFKGAPSAHPHATPALHVLVRSSDTGGVCTLLQHMSSLASYTALHSVIQDSIGGVRTADQLNAGSALRGADNVTLIGDIALLKKEEVTMLNTALERRAVVVGKKQSEIFPLHCSLWGYSDPPGREGPSPPWDIVYTVSQPAEGLFHAVVEGEGDDLLPLPDLGLYLRLAADQSVQIDSSCTRLIDGYCQAAKSVRYGSGCEMPVNAASTLNLMSANHARINLRQQVLDVDAVVAIKLYEEALFLTHRYSTVDLTPVQHVRVGDMEKYLEGGIDEVVESFYARLVTFCTTHIPGFTVNED